MDRETILWAVIVLVYLIMVAFVLTRGRVIQGDATVVDGDSLTINGSSVRLYGIDAPEAEQSCIRNGKSWPCGVQAARHLHRLIDGRAVKCRAKGRDGFERTLAICRAGDIQLNAAMVETGMALAFVDYSRAYVRHQIRAEQASRGLWAGQFVPPWVFRRGCLIKGNINSKGKKIYHVPGSHAYRVTQIDEVAGERWFCTEGDALRAGWQPVQ